MRVYWLYGKKGGPYGFVLSLNDAQKLIKDKYNIDGKIIVRAIAGDIQYNNYISMCEIDKDDPRLNITIYYCPETKCSARHTKKDCVGCSGCITQLTMDDI